MTPLQQAERALSALVSMDYMGDPEVAVMSFPTLMKTPQETAECLYELLASLRAAQNQPDAGAVVDACEAALDSTESAAWDGHYGRGLTVAYARAVSEERKKAMSLIRAYRESQPGLWRPIADAPRDPQKEERILAFNRANKKQYVIWATYEGWTDGELDDDGEYSCWGFRGDFITHWMPLPPPPAQEGGTA